MTAAVKTVTEKISTKGDKNAILTLDDGTEVWTPSYEKAVPLVGKVIPPDWFQKEGQYGPQAFPPKEGGGGGYKGGGGSKASWYNSEDGVRFTQERTDRRTALMQAVDMAKSSTAIAPDALGDTLRISELFYDWLRETSPAVPDLGKVGVAETVVVGEQTNSPTATTYPDGTYPADWPTDERR